MAVQPVSRVHAATSRASSTPTASPTRSSRSGSGPRRCRPSPRSRPTSTSSPTGWTCAATSCFNTEVVAMTFDEDDTALDGRHGAGERFTAPVRGRRRGHPVGTPRTRHPGHGHLRGHFVVHQPVARRGRRPHRQARRRHRHRLDRGAADPRGGQGGRAPHCVPALARVHAAVAGPRRSSRASSTR